jgi:hypothetical protein
MVNVEEYSLVSLYQALPEYATYPMASVSEAMRHLRDICRVSGTIEGLKEELESIVKSIKKLDIFMDEKQMSIMEEFYNILFGPVEHAPLYISKEGYCILANLRLRWYSSSSGQEAGN